MFKFEKTRHKENCNNLTGFRLLLGEYHLHTVYCKSTAINYCSRLNSGEQLADLIKTEQVKSANVLNTENDKKLSFINKIVLQKIDEQSLLKEKIEKIKTKEALPHHKPFSLIERGSIKGLISGDDKFINDINLFIIFHIVNESTTIYSTCKLITKMNSWHRFPVTGALITFDNGFSDKGIISSAYKSICSKLGIGYGGGASVLSEVLLSEMI